MKLTLQEAKNKYESKFITFKETSQDVLVVSVYEENGIIMALLSHRLSTEKGLSPSLNHDILTIERKFNMKN
jgi:hypothetical protein